MKYVTGIEALNYHGADWHSVYFDYTKVYPDEIRTWCGDYGIVRKEDREIANPVRAFLDYILYLIKYKNIVPTKRIQDLNFSDDEENDIKEAIERYLEPYLRKNEEDYELFLKWKKYNDGGIYEYTTKSFARKEAWIKMLEKIRANERDNKNTVR